MRPRQFLPPIILRKAHHSSNLIVFFISFAILSYLSLPQLGWITLVRFSCFNWSTADDSIDPSSLPGARKVSLSSIRSSWHCTSENDLDSYNRSRICFVKNLCVDTSGAYMVGPSDELRGELFPRTSMLSVGQYEDSPWKPSTRPARSDVDAYYLNEKIFVYGLYVPSHFAHWLYNGFMPVYSAMREYNATDRSWLLRATTSNCFPELDPPRRFATDYITNGYEIVESSLDIAGSSQILAPRTPICFAEAIVGTGGRLSQPRTSTAILSSDYRAYAEQVHSYYSTSELVKHLGGSHDEPKSAVNEKVSVNFAEDACIRSAKVHNPGGNRPIAVIIQRKKRRHVTNLSELANYLAKVHDLTVREVTFDNGCAIGPTAAVVHGADVLISPHGSQLASAVFMPHATAVISIDGGWYTEPWFEWPMVAMSRRFYHWTCDQLECRIPDKDLMRSLLEEYNARLTPEEISILANGKPGLPEVEALLRNHTIAIAWENYRKDAPRKIADIPKFGRFVRWLIDDTIAERKDAIIKGQREIDFVNLCERKGCCGPVCEPIGKLLYGRLSAFGKLVNDLQAAEEAEKKIQPLVWEDEESA